MSLLQQAADLLYSINPTLLKDPPRATSDGFCYLGPDGGTEGAVPCKDILYSEATCVGSWMLPAERHILEGIIVTLAACLALRMLLPKLHKTVDVKNIKVQHPPWAPAASLFCFSAIMCYKYFGYPSRVYYMVMPCNMQWVLSFLQCFLIPESWVFCQYTLLQMRVTYIMSVIIAIVTPETDDCDLPGEFIFYWVNHFILLILPAAYMANGSVSCFPPQSTSSSSTQVSNWSFNFLWWAYSCTVMAIFYFIPVTLMAVYSGLNLNFMLHPPHDHFVLTGQWYRLKSVGLLAVLFGVSRLLAYGYEKASLGGSISNKTKSKSS